MVRRSTGRAGFTVAGLGFGLAGGLLLGTLLLAPALDEPVGDQQETVSREEHEQLRADAERAESGAAAADDLITQLSPPVVTGALEGRPVLVLHTHDAGAEDVEGIGQLLGEAGATEAGRIRLEESFFSQDGADQLSSVVANTLPAGTELSENAPGPGTHAGQALGSALLLNPESAEQQASPEERALLLGTLRDSGFLSYEDGTILPAQLTVLLLGEGEDTFESFTPRSIVSFARALDARGNGMVLAGPATTARQGAALDLLRADETAAAEVSTVDSLDRSWGRLATVLALREQLEGGTGAYGDTPSAQSPAPGF